MKQCFGGLWMSAVTVRYCNHAPIDNTWQCNTMQLYLRPNPLLVESETRLHFFVEQPLGILVYESGKDQTKSVSVHLWNTVCQRSADWAKGKAFPLKSTWQMQIAPLYSKCWVSLALQKIASVPCIHLSRTHQSGPTELTCLFWDSQPKESRWVIGLQGFQTAQMPKKKAFDLLVVQPLEPCLNTWPSLYYHVFWQNKCLYIVKGRASQQPLFHFSCKKVDVAEKVLAHGEEWTTVLDQKTKSSAFAALWWI